MTPGTLKTGKMEISNMTQDIHERLESLGCYVDAVGNWMCPNLNKTKIKVAIFGSARTESDSGLYKSVERMAHTFAQEGWTIVTGGGPGTMEAANKGAQDVCPDGVCSLAQAIYLPFEEAINKYVQEHTKHDDFYSRLKTFAECDVFIVTPGGIGTLLEMAMVYQLIQVNHLERKPVICVGKMWRTFREWIEHEMLESEFLTYDEMKMVHYVDRFSEATTLALGLMKDK